MIDIEFYQKHLNQVSRSFAFCIETLDNPLRRWVSSSYLICRLLDTIEDAEWEDFNNQSKQFEVFNKLLAGEHAHISRWSENFPDTIPDSERALVSDASEIFRDFSDFPDVVKEAIRGLVQTMSYGMIKYKVSQGIQINSMSELNRYCFYVAGVVGELLTKLVSYLEPKFIPNKQLYKNAYHFGLFLQKVNLLKDQIEDEKLDRRFIYNRSEVMGSLKHHAEGGFNYINSIPEEQKSYRLFCAWSLFLGLASVPWMKKSYEQKKLFKIPRVKTLFLINKIEKLILKPNELKEYFDQLILSVSNHQTDFIGNENNNESGEAQYFGELSKNELKSVGIIL